MGLKLSTDKSIIYATTAEACKRLAACVRNANMPSAVVDSCRSLGIEFQSRAAKVVSHQKKHQFCKGVFTRQCCMGANFMIWDQILCEKLDHLPTVRCGEVNNTCPTICHLCCQRRLNRSHGCGRCSSNLMCFDIAWSRQSVRCLGHSGTR